MSPSRSRRRRPRKKSNTKKIIAIVAVIAIIPAIIIGYIVLNDNSNQEKENLSVQMKVLFETSMGNITIQLRDDMPITTSNFKNLVQQGIYDGTIFHRVISDFMIQGGDPFGTGQGDPSIPDIQDELSEIPENRKNLRGTLSMAKKGDPITGLADYNPSVAASQVTTIDMEKGLVAKLPPSEAEIPAPEVPETPACSSDYTFVSDLNVGSIGDEVRALQELLKCLGYFPADVDTTGYYGPVT